MSQDNGNAVWGVWCTTGGYLSGMGPQAAWAKDADGQRIEVSEREAKELAREWKASCGAFSSNNYVARQIH